MQGEKHTVAEPQSMVDPDFNMDLDAYIRTMQELQPERRLSSFRLRNAAAGSLALCFEPWGDYIGLVPGATYVLVWDEGGMPLGQIEIEWGPDCVAVHCNSGTGTLSVFRSEGELVWRDGLLVANYMERSDSSWVLAALKALETNLEEPREDFARRLGGTSRGDSSEAICMLTEEGLIEMTGDGGIRLAAKGRFWLTQSTSI